MLFNNYKDGFECELWHLQANMQERPILHRVALKMESSDMCHFDVKSYTPCRSVHALHSRLLCGLTLNFITHIRTVLWTRIWVLYGMFFMYTLSGPQDTENIHLLANSRGSWCRLG